MIARTSKKITETAAYLAAFYPKQPIKVSINKDSNFNPLDDLNRFRRGGYGD